MSKKDKNNKRESGTGESFRALALFTQLGLSMAACVFLGVMGGRFLDGRLGTQPLFLLLGAVVGGASSIKVMYDLAKKEWR